jgi:hypothetical protein
MDFDPTHKNIGRSRLLPHFTIHNLQALINDLDQYSSHLRTLDFTYDRQKETKELWKMYEEVEHFSEVADVASVAASSSTLPSYVHVGQEDADVDMTGEGSGN